MPGSSSRQVLLFIRVVSRREGVMGSVGESGGLASKAGRGLMRVVGGFGKWFREREARRAVCCGCCCSER